MAHRYKLIGYSGPKSRGKCPECMKSGVFAEYIDTDTSETFDPSHKTGRCNRESSCGYHYTPKQYFTDNGIEQDYKENDGHQEKPKPPIAYIDKDVFNKSLTAYDKNKFVLFLNTLFDEKTVQALITSYNIGSSGTWPGATTFWYVDILDRINYGKIMVYNQVTGKRDKFKNNHCANVLEKSLKKAKQALPEWLVKYQQNETKINCLFGEHLLKAFPQKPVAIVESEKTAIIASVYLPQFLWLACGSLGNLSHNRCKALAGRSVTLYPDLNAFDKWREKGYYLKFKVSSILETNCTSEEKQAGLDIADYLVKVSAPSLTNLSTPVPKTDMSELRNSSLTETELKSKINPEVLRLHTQYTAAEAAGKLDDHPQRSWIGSMWQGVMIYHNKPAELQYYIEQLNSIKI